MPEIFVATDEAIGDRLRDALAPVGTVAAAGVRTETRRYLDSFDWRLHGSGQVLVASGDELRLERLRDGAVRQRASGRAGRPVRFADDAPAGRLRDELARRLKVRALIHLATADVTTATHEVRNEDGKIVLRIDATRWQLSGRDDPPPALTTVTLRPVRGYPEVAARAAELCREAGLAPATVAPQAWVLTAAGLEPGGYSSKPAIPLTPDLTARQAVRRIAGHLLRVMRQNEGGLRADLDTEFLHDFRVAIRRTRSLLGQTKAVFPEGALAEFRREFKALGALTGPLRDLDVNLLEADRYREMLPPALRPGLDAHFDRLRAQRREAHAQLVAVLDSEEYARLVRRWTAFLSPPAGKDLPATAASEMPAVDLARQRIARQHARVLERGGAIDDTTPDVALHRLRIECKKLRYLLELFAALFPPGEIKALVGHLKKLQDHLGEFNDLSVQQARLHEEMAALPGRGAAARAEIAALGGLVAVLASRQHEVRQAFAVTFAAFARKSVSHRFAALGAAPEDEV